MTIEAFEHQINVILSMLPDSKEGQEKRSCSLTKRDGEILAEMIRLAVASQACSLGLTEAQAMALKELPPENIRAIASIVKERRRVLAAIGTLVMAILVAVGTGAVNAMDFSWIKKLFK